MKQLFASAAALLLACSAQAQIQKGNWVVSTTISASSESRLVTNQNNVERYRAEQVVPQLQVGHFIKDRLAVGVQAKLSTLTPRPSDFPNQVTAGVFARNYWPISPRFAAFLHTDLTYSPQRSYANGGIGLGTQLGFAYFTRKAFALEAKANFLRLAANYSWLSPDTRAFTFQTSVTTANTDFELSLAWYLNNRTDAASDETRERPSIRKGTRAWGGTINSNGTILGNESKAVYAQTFFTAGPNYSVFVRDNVATGIGLSGSILNSRGFNDLRAVTWTLGVTPYARYYLMLSESLGVFLQASAGVQYSESYVAIAPTGQPYTPWQRTWFGELGARPGVHYFLGKRWAIEGMAGLTGFTYNNFRAEGSSLNPFIEKNASLRFSNELGLGGFGIGLKYFVR